LDAEILFPLLSENYAIDIPRYISIFGFNLYIYGIFITLGFGLAAVYLIKRRDVFGLTKDNMLDLVIMAVPCGLIGARIYYILFNFESYFGEGQVRNIFMLREGGLAVYGGILGGFAAFAIYSRIKKVHLGKLLDAAAFGLFIGQAIGRWGNFVNREAYGVETRLPWRMGLRTVSTSDNPWHVDLGPIAHTTYVHPAFLYESIWNVLGLIGLHILSKLNKTKYYGQYFLLYVAWYGLGRFMIEGIRIDSLYVHGTDIRVSQLLAAVSCVAALVILGANHFRGVRSPVEENSESGILNLESSDAEKPTEGDNVEAQPEPAPDKDEGEQEPDAESGTDTDIDAETDPIEESVLTESEPADKEKGE